MKIDWEISGGAVLCLLGKLKVIIVKREDGFAARIYDMQQPLRSAVAEKTCNNLIEALHWAEDELKFQTGRKSNNEPEN